MRAVKRRNERRVAPRRYIAVYRDEDFSVSTSLCLVKNVCRLLTRASAACNVYPLHYGSRSCDRLLPGEEAVIGMNEFSITSRKEVASGTIDRLYKVRRIDYP